MKFDPLTGLLPRFVRRVRLIFRPRFVSRADFQKLDDQQKAARFREFLWFAGTVQTIISGGFISVAYLFYFCAENVYLDRETNAALLLFVIGFFSVYFMMFPPLWEMEKFERFPWADDYESERRNTWQEDMPGDWDDEK